MAFSIYNLPDSKIASMVDCGVWQPDCPVKLEYLRLLEITHVDFDGQNKTGHIVVHQAMSENVILIFKQLYQRRFPIAQVETIEVFGGDDDVSMRANNSSCFNYRKIKGTDRFSIHSYGLAIDINPVQNPCISFLDSQNKLIDTQENLNELDQYHKKIIDPVSGENYLDRNNQRPGMVEPIVDIFKDNGFDIWGGDWQNPVDYHHFQVSANKLKQL